MQLIAMFRKEIQILLSNRLLIFANVLIPILVICVNLIYTESAIIDIKVGYYGEQPLDTRIKIKISHYSDEIVVDFLQYENEKEAKEAYNRKEISCFMHLVDLSNIDIYYDCENQKSTIAYQYLIAVLRDINAEQYTKELIQEIMEAQTFVVREIFYLTQDKSEDLNPYIWTGFIWIFVYNNLSLAIAQMQQEKNTKTILYLCKIGVSKCNLFVSKAVAGLLQFILILAAFIVVTVDLGLLDFHFWGPQIFLWLLACVCIISIGHLLGTLINNTSIQVIIQMLIVLPLMLINALQTSVFDTILKRNPIYCCISVARSAMLGQIPSNIDIGICICTITICYTIVCLYLDKQEPIKLCRLR